MCVCILILCLNFLSYSKIRLDFPKNCFFNGYVYMDLLIQLFQLLQKFIFIYFLKLFIPAFLFLSVLLNLYLRIHTQTKQCFYYKNYTSLKKKVFNRHISITNSFKNLKTKKHSYSISGNDKISM